MYRSKSSNSEFDVIGVSTSTEYIDSNIESNVTYYYMISAYWNGVEAEPSKIVSIKPLITYNIEAMASNGGSISPSGNVKVTNGASQSFNISANTGYSILDVKVDGVSKGNISSYTFSNIKTDHSIYAIFGISAFTITATAGNGGSILPSGNIDVAYGSNQTFNISPNTGYSIQDIKVDGKSVGAMTNYRFDNITTNHSIVVYFGVNQSNPISLIHSIPNVAPESIAINGNNLWISDSAKQKMYKINPQNGSVMLSVNYMFSGLTFVGDYLYGVGGAPKPNKTIYKMNSEDGTILSSIPLKFDIPSPCSLAYDGNYFWIGNASNYARIYKVNPEDGSLIKEFTPPEKNPAGLAHDGNNLWMATYNPDKIYKVNPENLSVILSFEAPEADKKAGDIMNPTGIDFDEKGFLWAIIGSDSIAHIYKIDTSQL